ncbi:addiction module antitoxin [Sinorhizobium alkalisoli]|uniref:Addiction module antitoxin n=2 Tax=Sinorhizobium alkalisoli TaxID=1752398 RepID=A0A1E3VD35_9HYPH|nr:addiction module antitoxin [Sinorhizobium alkalisoli]
MAARIERAFGISSATLLDMQAEFTAALKRAAGAPADAKAYVPPFLQFKANDITDWVNHNIPARSRLAVLLRTLVNSTGIRLEQVDFPGNDDAERPGWDGFTVAGSGTPWIPAGQSGWEFGVNADVKTKADGDFVKSVKAHKKADREKITFVFVTPRSWKGKDAWVSSMRAKKQWKDVRVFDASDLEQWLEQSLAGQTWFANETGRPSDGVRSLEQCWTDWANVGTPTLSGALFETAIAVHRAKVKEFIARPAGEPLVVAADSVEEALAFLAQVLAEPEFESDRDRVLVFDRTGVLPKLAKGSHGFIAVAHTREVERELGPHINQLKTIVVYPRNATNHDPHILLEPLGTEAFRKGLGAMKLDEGEIKRLSHSSGQSLTVLRRQLSKVEAIKTPHWASDSATSTWLIPMMFVGAWNVDNESDREALSLIANMPFEELERRVQELVSLNDAPLWSIGSYRGVVSKIDTLFAIARWVTSTDLDRYLEMAKMVLAEDDPALDLPEKERWAAAMHGKRREFSGALRNGISETLVLLAVHGKHLFQRLGFDGETQAALFIRELLVPLTTRKLEANDSDLPVYAEAAPETFLAILEEDLRQGAPAVLGLLRPIDTSFFGVPCIRSGLLWALEGLAWNPATFLRSVLILGRLSQVEIKDNWANKPIASLETIFRSWMPQTAADHEQRLMAMNKLIERFPEIGWKVCIDQFGGWGNDVGRYSHKPKWRPDGYGFGEPFEFMEPVQKFRAAMVELALSQPSYTPEMLCDLVGRLHRLGSEFQVKVWQQIENWIATGASDDDIAKVREKIRVTVLSRRGRRRAKDGDFAALNKKAKAIYDSMEPKDVINKHEWLFRQAWVEESADELDDDQLDFRKREERIAALRREALREIYQERGTAGIFELASRGQAQHQIGVHMVMDVLDASQAQSFIFEALQPGVNETAVDRKILIAGAMRALGTEGRVAVLEHARETMAETDVLRLLLLSSFDKRTWVVVDRMPAAIQNSYWLDVHPEFIFESEDDNNEAIERLLKAKRPRAAFSAVHFKLEAIRPALIVEMLSDMASGGMDRAGEYQLQEYDIRTAFELVDRNPDVTRDQKAGLEFAYIDVLSRMFGGDDSNHIPNLERYIEDHPEMFVQALVWAYKRRDGGEDPIGFRIPDGRKDLSERAFHLLEGIERIPGLMDDGSFDVPKLRKWISQVREKSAELDRQDICDLCLGKLMSHAPEGVDGVWPCEEVRDVIEELRSKPLTDGAHTALYNQRGVHFRGEGGGQERELADKYRAWADALQFTHPFLSASLLMGMVRTYEREAEREGREAGIRRRLRH